MSWICNKVRIEGKLVSGLQQCWTLILESQSPIEFWICAWYMYKGQADSERVEHLWKDSRVGASCRPSGNVTNDAVFPLEVFGVWAPWPRSWILSFVPAQILQSPSALACSASFPEPNLNHLWKGQMLQFSMGLNFDLRLWAPKAKILDPYLMS